MRQRSAPLPVPSGRRFVCLHFQDDDAIQAELAGILERVQLYSRELASLADPSQKERAEVLKAEILKLRADQLEIQGRHRSIWFTRSTDPRAMACYSWVYGRGKELGGILSQAGRTEATFEEFHAHQIVPFAALIGLLWHDLALEMETRPPVLSEGGYDFQAYGQAILGELLDHEGGLGVDVVYSLGNDLLDKAAGTYIGLHKAQERADFLGVRRGRPSEPPSA